MEENKRYRILAADDEPIERIVVEKLLRKWYGDEAEIVLVQNGRAAVEEAQKGRFHAVIMDIGMPGINGLDAAERIREWDKDCAIIFLTAYDEFSYAKRAISVRALDYLLKPVSEEELLTALEEAFSHVSERANSSGMGFSQEKAASVLTETAPQEPAPQEPAPQEQASQGQTSQESASERDVRTGDETAAAFAGGSFQSAILPYIERFYPTDISLQSAATAMGYSDAYFCRLFKQCFSKSFTSYLTEYRLTKAKELLSSLEENVREIGARVGYPDANYFTKVFKRAEGVTPREYRRSLLRERGENEEREA